MIILPTHHCFDDMIDYIVERVKERPQIAFGQSVILVHGILLSPDMDEPFAHAWVEEGLAVVQSGLVDGERIFFQLARMEFVQKMRPQKRTRYTIRDAYLENHRTNSYGPWLPEYRALCGRETRRIMGSPVVIRRCV